MSCLTRAWHWRTRRASDNGDEAVCKAIVDTVDRLDTVDVPELTALLSTFDPRRHS
jgi:2-methylcitrate dehydratase